MRTFNAAFENELVKLFKRKKPVIAAILTLLAAVGGHFSVSVIKTGFGIMIVDATGYPLLALSIMSYTIIPLFLAFAVIDLFGGEYTSYTMKVTLCRPVCRWKIYLAKVCAAGTLVFANLIYIMFLSIISGTILFGLHVDMLKVLSAYLAAFLPLLVLIAMVALIANITRHGVLAFMLSVVAFIVLNALSLLFTKYSSYFIVPYFDWYNLFIGAYFNLQKVVRVFLILFGCGVMFFAAGVYLFERKEY